MAKNEQDSGKTITITTRPGLTRFCRAGLCFGVEPTTVVVADLPKGGLDALKNEPNLVVSE